MKRGVRGVSSAISALVGGLIPRASESSRFSLSRLGLPQAAMTQQQNYNYDLNVRPTECTRYGDTCKCFVLDKKKLFSEIGQERE